MRVVAYYAFYTRIGLGEANAASASYDDDEEKEKDSTFSREEEGSDDGKLCVPKS